MTLTSNESTPALQHDNSTGIVPVFGIAADDGLDELSGLNLNYLQGDKKAEMGTAGSSTVPSTRITNLLAPEAGSSANAASGPADEVIEEEQAPPKAPFTQAIPLDKLACGAEAAKSFFSWGFSKVKETVQEVEATKQLAEKVSNAQNTWMQSEARKSVLDTGDMVKANVANAQNTWMQSEVRKSVLDTGDVVKANVSNAQNTWMQSEVRKSVLDTGDMVKANVNQINAGYIKPGLDQAKLSWHQTKSQISEQVADVSENVNMQEVKETTKDGLKTFATSAASAAIWFQSMGRSTESDSEDENLPVPENAGKVSAPATANSSAAAATPPSFGTSASAPVVANASASGVAMAPSQDMMTSNPTVPRASLE